MAVSLLSHDISDLCLGKPAIRSISISATVADALSVLTRIDEGCISVWRCGDHSSEADSDLHCRCVGKVCMVDIICFLCRQENLLQPAIALRSPISVLIPEGRELVRHLEPHASLMEAIDLIRDGVHNLVIPINMSASKRRNFLETATSNSISSLHNDRQYCWLAPEDIIRYLLNSIGLFSPTAASPINSVNIIETNNIFTVHYDDSALSILPLISQALIHQSSVAIVDLDDKLVGEISPFTLNFCDETLVAAIATLTAGELMAYIDCGGPPDDLVQLVKERLEEKNLEAVLEFVEEESSPISSSSSICSLSDDEFGCGSGRSWKIGGYSARVLRRSEAIVCHPWNSLVAVMIQALAHRVSYVWVIQEDGTLAGTVTFASMLAVFRDRLKSVG
ncbi:CBS domain-containing protein CBSX5-like [Cucurbita pepo subsp. pepo]|uniref:CBS domain-containing protein CBSX5-like n=1 Tax=Cucurbita pepo subsp. pepo TaxID=3664 RepID=UPI000C9D2977|nr:CBS domain-containing protein CBSX5-like [Cucurbita pepo subsp. pepo]